MKHYTLLFLLLLTTTCFAQYPFDKSNISTKTLRAATKLEKVNRVMGSGVGEAGTRPKQYDHFVRLQKKATPAELIELTNHPNGVVRCYAFWALSEMPSVDLMPIIVNHIHDTTSVETLFGCIGGTEKVGDFFFSVVMSPYGDLNAKKLTRAEFEYLDSLLVYSPNDLDTKIDAIRLQKPTEAFYTRARELVIQEGNPFALSVLASYQKAQDVSLILHYQTLYDPNDGFFYTCKAIQKFPHPAFFPLLRQRVQNMAGKKGFYSEYSDLYKAIARYKNDSAYILLQTPFNAIQDEEAQNDHAQWVLEAIQAYYAPVYDPLLWQLWEQYHRINPRFYRLLCKKNPEKALSATVQTFQNIDAVSTELLNVMLDTLLENDRPLAIALINKNIRNIGVFQFNVFADKALKIKDPSFVTSLFDRLDKEHNAHVYLKITRVLIAYKDNDINRRIVAVSKTNPHLRKGWGGKDFSKLLKEKGIE